MHELSIAQSLIDVASDEARRAGASRVVRLTCRVGALRQVQDDLLREAFEIARAGTCCRDAELCVEPSPLTAFCPRCGVEFRVEGWRWECPTCRTEGEPRSGGDELELVSIEAEADP